MFRCAMTTSKGRALHRSHKSQGLANSSSQVEESSSQTKEHTISLKLNPYLVTKVATSGTPTRFH